MGLKSLKAADDKREMVGLEDLTLKHFLVGLVG